MIDYTFFEKLLSERLNKLCESIEHKNTHHKDNGDIVGAGLQGNLEMGMIDLYQQEINDIRNSLQKIKDGVFGICEMCDDDIDVERLKAKPHAKYCINCRELFEKTQKKER
ncbi:TraR/DksA C4-type zinc finger protein [Helicobacter typhlonius]|uniref:C4-type zinc finger protein, DksA/TraR family n=1 Tax=Helicobacter typhlonius TaxID=76936 RepID=A0A0S4PRV9_9HELI|nr:TraR/DksA C4-type zinc finger protein [Helicobacter typhlonius]CUU39005.1 C4-type zinc finger protein, DksA/TraR family [Helicobacter typhlonius]